jgi:hypothetical protein
MGKASGMAVSLVVRVLLALPSVLPIAVCECNRRAEMTVLNVGRFAGLGVVDAPKRPIVCKCRYVPKHPIVFCSATACYLTDSRQSNLSAQKAKPGDDSGRC